MSPFMTKIFSGFTTVLALGFTIVMSIANAATAPITVNTITGEKVEISFESLQKAYKSSLKQENLAKQKYELNDSGQVVIVQPKFNHAGRNYYFAEGYAGSYSQRQLSGICKHFGLDEYVTSTKVRSKEDGLALVENDGQFDGIDEADKPVWKGGSALISMTQRIDSITCDKPIK
jgi:hypothetical protein